MVFSRPRLHFLHLCAVVVVVVVVVVVAAAAALFRVWPCSKSRQFEKDLLVAHPVSNYHRNFEKNSPPPVAAAVLLLLSSSSVCWPHPPSPPLLAFEMDLKATTGFP